MEALTTITAKGNEQKLITVLFIFCFLLLFLLVGVFYFSGKRIKELKQTEVLYEQLQDTIKTVKNKLGQYVTSTAVLNAENTQLFTNIKTKDEDIVRLQNVVKTYEKKIGDLNTALAISDETVMDLQDSLKSTIVGYSTHIDTTGCPVQYPIYSRAFVDKDNWYNGTIKLGIDTINLHILSRNSYDVTIGEKRTGLFKKQLFADVTNLNPNTETRVLKVYQKKEIKTTFGDILLKSGTKIAIGIGIGYLLFK